MQIDEVCESIQKSLTALGRYKSNTILRLSVLSVLSCMLFVSLFDDLKGMLTMIALTFILEFYFWDAITSQYWNHSAIIFNRVFIANSHASVRWVSYFVHYAIFLSAYLFVLGEKLFF